ncbi:hypothetical protein [Mammaliicoccus sciuri]|uniref:hypothetical protein n=1 Tax=Mammaliicoccus sciuri TaxID=1296 RepID=UPI002B259D5A|nr:hypothetical protein [Mammaliicoccus sciuri]WQK75286.1 hypothetical protein P3U33_06010 [Mammaliicoccus sciuri]
MTRLLYASELKEITEQNMSTKAKELLEFIIKETMKLAKNGKYSLDIQDRSMPEIISILKRKEYKIIQRSKIDLYTISWD